MARGPVRFPPPLIYLGMLLLGLAAERIIPLPHLGLDRRLLIAVGALLALAGAGLVAAASGRFRRAGTPAPPWLAPTAIVTGGIYRFTRNPMYLGMAVLQAGLAIALDAPIALLFVPVTMLLIQTQVIAREENYMESRFGDEYRRYRQQVRRWF